MPTTPDPYTAIVWLLAAARDEAARRSDLDNVFPSRWANAEMALQLAITGLPDPEPGSDDAMPDRPSDHDCLGLAVRAISLFDRVDLSQRRPEHLLDLAYAVSAADEIRRALRSPSGRA